MTKTQCCYGSSRAVSKEGSIRVMILDLNGGTGAGDQGRVTDEEIAGIVKFRGVGKVTSPDGIPNLTLKVALAWVPGMFRTTIQKCLDEDPFPEIRK